MPLSPTHSTAVVYVGDKMPANDYSVWDPEAYCDMYFGKKYFDDDSKLDECLEFLFSSLSEVYSSGKIRGETLLDIGTGPTLYSLISAAQHIPNIYLSDFLECNRDALWRWIVKDPKAIDHSHLFTYVSKRQESSWDCKKLQNLMRSRIRAVVGCDVTLKNPLCPSIFPQFDVISTSLCLSVLSANEYETAVKNVATLLKPGGWLVYVDSLKGQYYMVGEHKFWNIYLTKDIVTTAVEKAGLNVHSWTEYCAEAEKIDIELSDIVGMFCLTARKPVSSCRHEW